MLLNCSIVAGAWLVITPLPQIGVGLVDSFTITAAGTLPLQWALEASSDLQHWQTITTGINSPLNYIVSNGPRVQFYRLKGL